MLKGIRMTIVKANLIDIDKDMTIDIYSNTYHPCTKYARRVGYLFLEADQRIETQ